MEKILKTIDTKGETKKKEIYKLLKTNSQKINSEISKKIKSFNKIDDFITYYSNKTPLLEFLNCMEFNPTKILIIYFHHSIQISTNLFLV